MLPNLQGIRHLRVQACPFFSLSLLLLRNHANDFELATCTEALKDSFIAQSAGTPTRRSCFFSALTFVTKWLLSTSTVTTACKLRQQSNSRTTGFHCQAWHGFPLHRAHYSSPTGTENKAATAWRWHHLQSVAVLKRVGLYSLIHLHGKCLITSHMYDIHTMFPHGHSYELELVSLEERTGSCGKAPQSWKHAEGNRMSYSPIRCISFEDLCVCVCVCVCVAQQPI